MFHKSTDVNLKENKVNSGHTTTIPHQGTHNYNRVLFTVIDYFTAVAQPFAAWTRMNQLTGVDDGSTPSPKAVTTGSTPKSSLSEADPVEINNVISPNPSPLHVPNVADMHTHIRSTLNYTVGYPLSETHPFSQRSKEYLRNSVNVRGVGFVREDGTIGLFFNICLPQSHLINPPFLQHDRSLGTPEHLYLTAPFAKRSVGVSDRTCNSGQGLAPAPTDASHFRYKGLNTLTTNVSIPTQKDNANQCAFLRTSGVTVRQDIFNDFCTRRSCTGQSTQLFKGCTGTSLLSRSSTSEHSMRQTTMSAGNELDGIILHHNFNLSPDPVHHSTLINTALLNQVDADFIAKYNKLKPKRNSDALMLWCDLLHGNFTNKTVINIARPYPRNIDKSGCISLDKISDSIRILNDTSYLPQETETSVLQRSLITFHRDRPCLPATNTPTLPLELVERILLLLDIKYILTCRLINKEFNEFIQSSASLQYFLACKSAGVTDNSPSSLSYSERLEALEKREDAWRKLKPVFEMEIKIDHLPFSTSTYSLNGGTYFLKDNNQRDLHYCRLPSSPQENPRWIRIRGHGPGEGLPGILVSFAIDIYEHDLIVNVVSSDIGNQATTRQHSLDLVPLKFSTGELHPDACQHRIHVQESPSSRPWVIPRIVGDNLALIVHSQDGTCPDKLFIFDWKTGHKRLQHEAPEDAYSDLVFVSPEMLLVPNLVLSHIEVWYLPPSHPNSNPPNQILSLRIPPVSRDYFLSNLGCHGEPNPFLHSIPYFPPRPFFPSPESSIITMNLVISGILPSIRRRHALFTLIMHRHALLEAIQKWTSPSLLELGLPMWLTNEVFVHKFSGHDDGSFSLVTHSNLASKALHLMSSPTFATSYTLHMSNDPGFLSGFQYNFPQVQWSDWGPPISRWFQVNETQARWIMTSTGQRYAFLVPSDRRKLMISIMDFNQYNIRRNPDLKAQYGQGENKGSNGKSVGGEEEEWEMLDHEGIFSEEVYMGLKCAIYPAPSEYDFDGVLMDEERLLGLKCDNEGKVERVTILYFG